MSSSPHISESFADDLVGIDSYEASRPPKRDFLPWHHPRKQLVRHCQWRKQICKLLDEFPRSDGTFRYFGLPGADLLDLRYFHDEVCFQRELSLRFLGFNRSLRMAGGAQTELNISLDEISKLPQIDPRSDIIRDDFALVANKNSIAFRKARELGPFDVINLDLCDGFGRKPPGCLGANYYNALNCLLSLQSRSKMPWLLLLTTRCDRQNLDNAVLETFLTLYRELMVKCPPFLAHSRSAFKISTDQELLIASGSPPGLSSVFLAGLCGWIVALALGHRPPTEVSVRSIYGYRVDRRSGCEDLVSVALRFEPTFLPTPDPFGLASHLSPVPADCRLTARALRMVSRRVDADQRLAEDAELREAMVTATMTLLRSARYDVDAYAAWLQANPLAVKSDEE